MLVPRTRFGGALALCLTSSSSILFIRAFCVAIDANVISTRQATNVAADMVSAERHCATMAGPSGTLQSTSQKLSSRRVYFTHNEVFGYYRGLCRALCLHCCLYSSAFYCVTKAAGFGVPFSRTNLDYTFSFTCSTVLQT